EKADSDALLTFPLIDPQLPQDEVEKFCEPKIQGVAVAKSMVDWEKQVVERRTNMFERVIFRGQGAEWRKQPSAVVWLDELEGGPGYRLKKLRYEILPGLWVPAVLYEPTQLSGKVPVVMNVNGHDTNDGKAADYKQMRCINQAKRGM